MKRSSHSCSGGVRSECQRNGTIPWAGRWYCYRHSPHEGKRGSLARTKSATPKVPNLDVVRRFLDGESIEALAFVAFSRRRPDGGRLGDQLAIARAGVEEAIRAAVREALGGCAGREAGGVGRG